MAGKISVIGDVGVQATLAPGARGAAVLVAAAGEDVRPATRLAPAAVLLIADGSPEHVGQALDATLWARQRVLGVARDDLPRAVEAVLTGQPITLPVTLRDGEREVTLGRSGIVPNRPA